MRKLYSLILLSVCIVLEAAAGTIFVDAANFSGIEDGTATHPFNTLREGIAAASVGDTVLAKAGTYYPDEQWDEHTNALFLKAGVTLRGEGRTATIVEGYVADRQQSNLPIVLEDLSFYEFHFERGTHEGPFDQSVIRRCETSLITVAHAAGIPVGDSPGPIYGFLIEDNDLGIDGIIRFEQAAGLANDIVRNNRCGYVMVASGAGFTYLIDENDVQYGIGDASGACIATISNNRITNGAIIDRSGGSDELIEDEIIEGNTIVCDEDAPILETEDVKAAIRASSRSVTIRNNAITCTGDVSGITAESGAPFHVMNNTITVDEVMLPSADPEEGIIGVHNNSGWGHVTGNTIHGGDVGYYSTAGTAEFADNTITGACIGFRSAGAEEVHHNTITECTGDGMILHGLRGPIHHNTIRDNGGAGIRVERPRIDLGGGEYNCPGNNIIMGNGDYDLLIETSSAQYPVLFAEHNFWDHADSAGIALHDIYDGNDADGLVIVDFMPFDILGAGDLPLPVEALQLFPSPATTTLRLQPPIGLGPTAVMELFNPEGQRVARETIRPFADAVTLDVGNVPSGVYVFRLQDDAHTWTRRVVIAR
jgi:hypothetical protein